jgi:hypothetical protein
MISNILRRVFMSKTQSQLVNEAVINYVREVKKVAWEAGMIASEHLTRDDKSKIACMLAEAASNDPSMLPSGKTKVYETVKDIERHFRQYLSNNLRRSPELNGGVKRSELNEEKKGPRDAQLKALKQLLAKAADSDKADIEAHIARRTAELEATRKKETVIDLDALPAELRHLAE